MANILLKELLYTEDTSSTEFKKDMVDSINDHFSHNMDVNSQDFNFSREAAIYYFAESYHEGQGSDLYSILSTSDYKPGPMENFDSWIDSDYVGSDIYDFLEQQYGSSENEVPDVNPAGMDYYGRNEQSAPTPIVRRTLTGESIIKLESLRKIIQEEIQNTIKELSPNTYDDAHAAGVARGDARGERIASQAMKLKLKQAFNGKPLQVSDGYGTLDLQPIALKKGSPNSLWIRFTHKFGDKLDTAEIVLSEDGKLSINGGEYFVDRKTANLLAKIYNASYGGNTMKPNMIKQS